MATPKFAGSIPVGVEFVATDSVPEPPRKRDRDDEFWEQVATFLRQNSGKWFKVRDFDAAAAAPARVSNINNDRNRRLPAAEFEARSESDKDSNTSSLYLLHKEA